jgi:processive 1,2-diacylglycerol beta-glucosyltransferase
MGKRVLILSASVGSGHVKAADALARAMRERSDVEEVLCDDSLDHTNVLHKQFYSMLYKKLSEMLPEFLGWWYETSDDPWVADKSRLAIDLPQALPLISLVKEFRPDVILCTHFMPAGVISWLIANGKLEARLGVVVTDFHFHAFWITRAFNWYFVAQEDDKIHMEALGLPGDRIMITGIPVEPEFAQPVNADAVLRRHGLQVGRPTFLVVGGALGLSPATAVVRQLLNLDRDFQAVIVCGRNEKMQDDIVQLVKSRPGDFRVLGYTAEISELMAASTMILTKPGGMTTAEALARGLPMMILDPIGGQEERNSDVLLEAGAAVKCTEVTLVAHKLRRLLDDPPRLERMREAARKLGRPNAARDIARITLEEPEKRPVIISKLRVKVLRKRIAEGT